ncbi:MULTISPECIES: hypothetical protein [unclassified Halomonas]|uniref:hypothetical protein n=2 Tax=unclassified Halomonas TaxID=2609666 RepID=UPI003CF1924D
MNSFYQYGIKVYPFNNQWAVQHPGNVGLKETFGDTLHPSKKEAQIEAGLLAGISPKDANTPVMPFTPWLGGPLNQKESAYERRADLLNKQVVYQQQAITKKALIEQKVREGAKLHVREVPKIKDMSRMRDFRANLEEQREHERKQKAAGNKKEYSISWSDDNDNALFLDITKTEYDYAAYLIEEASSPNIAQIPKRSLTDLYTLWGKLRDVPTRENEDGVQEIDEGFLMFFSGEPVEEIWRWFEAQHPRLCVGEVMQGHYHRRQEIDMGGFGSGIYGAGAVQQIPVTI